MTIAELLADETLRRQEFPVAQHKVFLAHAAVSPLPRRVSEAMQTYCKACEQGDQEEVFGRERFTQARKQAAALIGALPDEIAWVGPTSLALSFVAGGLRFRKHDNILVYHDDYPSNVYPWMALAERGVHVRFLNVRHLGRIRKIDVEGQIDEQTRLVALASCHFVSGWRIDLPAIGRFLRQKRIAFCVDAIQTLGAFPTPAEWVDFMAADAHKWLLGPCAAGLLYVRREWQERLAPVVFGWHNLRCPEFVAQEQLVFRRDARRYEAGTANLVGLVGLSAAIELLVELGIDNIAAELLRKRRLLVEALTAKGYTVLNADAPEAHASAIVSFRRPGQDLRPLHLRLTEAGIVTSLRTDRAGTHYIRLSPHFYNTDAELQRALELL